MIVDQQPKQLRTVQIIFKVTADEKAALVRGAMLAGLRRSKWMRGLLLREVARLEESKGPEP